MLSYLLVAALIALPTFYPLRESLRGTLEHAEQRDLLAQVRELADQVRGQPEAVRDAEVKRFARVLQARVTLIDAAGFVIADSEVDTAALARLENHAHRPEIVRAHADGAGVDARHSSTTGVDLVYAAVPLDPDHRDGPIVRIATGRERVHETVADVMLALRVGVGVGISAALVLSLIAVLSVSVPLRRLRDVARAFASANWVEVKRPRAADELHQLADALDELGRQLRHQLVAVGAAEALVLQSVESLAIPAALLDATYAPLTVNGALRIRAELAPEVEEAVFAGVREELATAVTARRDRAPIQIRALARGAIPGDARFYLTALARPAAPPLWLVVLADPDLGTANDIRVAAEALADAEARLPAAAPELAELRAAVAGLIAALGTEPAAPTLPTRIEPVLRAAVAGVTDAPELATRLELPAGPPELYVVDRGGMAVRAVRLLLQLALGAAGDRRLAVTVGPDGDRVHVRVQGIAPDVTPLARLGRLLGAQAHRDQTPGREAIWLSLRRA